MQLPNLEKALLANGQTFDQLLDLARAYCGVTAWVDGQEALRPFLLRVIALDQDYGLDNRAWMEVQCVFLTTENGFSPTDPYLSYEVEPVHDALFFRPLEYRDATDYEHFAKGEGQADDRAFRHLREKITTYAHDWDERFGAAGYP